MPVYQSSPDAAPDSDFVSGALHYLVAGNRGRMLDPRRTPVSVVEVRVGTGFVVMRIDAFEDEGATWEVPLEDVEHYQFAAHSRRAPDGAVDAMRDAIERYDRELVIEATSDDRHRSEQGITQRQAEADDWLGERSRFLAEDRTLPDPTTRRGDETLAADLEAYMRDRDLWTMEATFASQFVSNPGAGEVVKGHRIALARLGLATYSGTIVRDPATLSGSWDLEHRVDHILARLAFLRALFARLEVKQVRLWRGLTAEVPLQTHRRRSFVSTSFEEAVARSHFESDAERPTRVLMCQGVPVERVFMTYLETRAMSDRFLEAEAVLLAHPGDGWP